MPKLDSGRFMVLNMNQIATELRNRALEFMYVRWDGQNTTQRVTMNPTYINPNVPPFDEETKQMRARFLNEALNEGWDKTNPPTPKLVIHVWDIEAGRWTSIPTWTVISLNYMNW